MHRSKEKKGSLPSFCLKKSLHLNIICLFFIGLTGLRLKNSKNLSQYLSVSSDDSPYYFLIIFCFISWMSLNYCILSSLIEFKSYDWHWKVFWFVVNEIDIKWSGSLKSVGLTILSVSGCKKSITRYSKFSLKIEVKSVFIFVFTLTFWSSKLKSSQIDKWISAYTQVDCNHVTH